MRPTERIYHSFDPQQPLDFLGDRFWHVQYHPEDRRRIAEEFKKRVEQHEDKIKKETFRRMKILLPEIINLNDSDLEVAFNKKRMRECQTSHDYKGMPKIVLVDSRYGTEYSKTVEAHIAARCEAIVKGENPLKIFENIGNLHAEIKVPPILYLERFHDIVTTARIKALEEMSDNIFVEYFGSSPGRVLSLGHRQLTDNNYLDNRFRMLLLTRYNRLIGTALSEM